MLRHLCEAEAGIEEVVVTDGGASKLMAPFILAP
jgi:hypothetical protein